MIILVRNIDRSISEEAVLKLLMKHGKVRSFDLVRDKDADRSKGFGFADMPSQTEATAMIAALDGYLLGTQKLRVKKAASSSLLKENPRANKKGKSYGKNPFKGPRPS